MVDTGAGGTFAFDRYTVGTGSCTADRVPVNDVAGQDPSSGQCSLNVPSTREATSGPTTSRAGRGAEHQWIRLLLLSEKLFYFFHLIVDC